MFPTKMFTFIAFLLIVLVQLNSIQYAEAGGDDDKIIIGGGHGCAPHFVLKEGKKGHTLIMNHDECHKDDHYRK